MTRTAPTKLVKRRDLWFDSFINPGRIRNLHSQKGMEMNDGTPSAAAGLIERAKAIILKPVQTWPLIAAERATPGGLITHYAIPLAAIAPLCGFIRGQLFGYGAFGFNYRPGLMAGLSTLIVSYALGLVGVVVLALIADWLAPKFDGAANRTNAFKLVVFASFAAWLAGAFQLIPGLGLLGLAGLYTLYLFYTGAAPLMKVPKDKSVAYTAVTLVCAAVLYWLVGIVTASFIGLFGLGGMPSMAANDTAASLTIPGVGKVDTGKIEQAGKQMEAAANGQITTVQPAQLQALLPATLGGYTRTALEANAMGQMGAEAEGTYTQGDKTIRLKVIDSAGLGALAGLGSAMGAQHSREDADGYERTNTVNGQMQIEKWEIKASRGEFTQQVGGRFMITAEGNAGSIDELKAAVAAIDQGQLVGLAK